MPVVTTLVTSEPLDLSRLMAGVSTRADGAAATFVGQVRDHDPEVPGQVVGLDYSAHPDAPEILARIVEQVLAAHDPEEVASVSAAHRVGSLAVGDLALVVCAASPHRDLAFRLTREIVEAIKADLPVWKKQHQSDGGHVWSGLSC